MSKKQSVEGGVGFAGLLTLLFIGLKLGNVIDWSWWWVLSPMWLGPASVIVFFVVVIVAVGFFAVIANGMNSRK
jgi:hypothetical protein